MDSPHEGLAANRHSSQLHDTLLKQPKFIRELIAGGVAGAVSKTCVAPLERTKILFQTRRVEHLGVMGTLRLLWRTEGWAGLFRGNYASVVRIVPYSATHFAVYEHYRRLLVDHVVAPAATVKAAGGAAGPSSEQPVVASPAAVAAAVYAPTAVVHPALTTPLSVHPVWDLLAGSASGATAVVLTYPLDLVRTQLAWATPVAPAAPPAPAGPTAPPWPRNPHSAHPHTSPAAVPSGHPLPTPNPNVCHSHPHSAPSAPARPTPLGGFPAGSPCQPALALSSTLVSPGTSRSAGSPPAVPSQAPDPRPTSSALSTSRTHPAPGSSQTWPSPSLPPSSAPAATAYGRGFTSPAGAAAAVGSSSCDGAAPRSIRGRLLLTLQQEGVVGLYRGMAPTLVGILAYSGLKFYVYQSLKAGYKATSWAGLVAAHPQPPQLPQPPQPQPAAGPTHLTPGMQAAQDLQPGASAGLPGNRQVRWQQLPSSQPAVPPHVGGSPQAAAADKARQLGQEWAIAGQQQQQRNVEPGLGQQQGEAGLGLRQQQGEAGLGLRQQQGEAGLGLSQQQGEAGLGLRQQQGTGRLPVGVMLLFGGVVGLVAQTATYPLDVVRRRMQVAGLQHMAMQAHTTPPASRQLPGVTAQTSWAVVRHILAEEGWRGLWRGLTINYIKVVPSTAIGFTLYDWLKQALDLQGNL